jgi:HSP20 family protein
MLIERWDPFAESRRPLRDFRSAGYHAAVTRPEGTNAEGARAESWRIPLDVVRDGDAVIVEASLPGVRPEDISVTIDDDVLRIAGHTGAEDERATGTYLLSERRTGSFARSVRVPDSVDADNAHTSYEAGVLTVTLPKLETKKAKQLTVEVKERVAVEAT